MKKGIINQIFLVFSLIVLLFAMYFIVSHSNNNAVFNVESLKLYSENYSTISTSVNVDKEVKPDYFTINVGVKITSDDVESGKEEVAKKINSIREELLKLGIKKSEIETLNFNVYKNYYWYDGKREFKNYTVSQTLRIKSYNLDLAGKVVDVSVKNGANNVGSLNFGIDDSTIDKVKEELLSEAVKKAYSQAKIVCENGNLELKGIKKLDINNYNYRPYYPVYAKAETLGYEDNSNVIIDEQNQKVTLSINVVFNAEMK